MNRREDLLELTPQALTALANAGFVKRAQREVAAGQLPTLTIDDQGVVTAVFDDGARRRHGGVGFERQARQAQCQPHRGHGPPVCRAMPRGAPRREKGSVRAVVRVV